MECVELQEVRDLKKTLYERKRADVSSTRIRFIFKGTINMQKSTLALALAKEKDADLVLATDPDGGGGIPLSREPRNT